MRIRRVAAFVAAVTIALATAPLYAQRNNNNNNQRPQRSKAELADLETLVRLVDGVAGGIQPAPADVPITWESNHFVKGQDGITYLPFTLNIDRTKLSKPDVAFYVRVVSKTPAAAAPAPAAEAKGDAKNQPAARPTYPWDNLSFIEVPSNGKLSRAIALKPGEYEAFITIKEKGTEKQERNAPPAKIGLLRKELSIPDFNVPELTTSSILVADAIEVLNAPLPPAQQEMNPYVFGPMKIGLSDGKFSKSGELNLVFWIYGAGAAAAGKPDVQIEYSFHQKLAEGEKYFNRTQPQTLNAQSLPPEFDVALGHQLPGTLTVPLSSFPSGDYRLEIKVTDKTTNKSVTQNVTFTVLPA